MINNREERLPKTDKEKVINNREVRLPKADKEKVIIIGKIRFSMLEQTQRDGNINLLYDVIAAISV